MKQSDQPILPDSRHMIKESLSRDQFRLYQLIWKRFTASQHVSQRNMKQLL